MINLIHLHDSSEMRIQKCFETGTPHMLKISGIPLLSTVPCHFLFKFWNQICFYFSVIKIRLCGPRIDEMLPRESLWTGNVNSFLLLLQISSYFVFIYRGKRPSVLPTLHLLLRYSARQPHTTVLLHFILKPLKIFVPTSSQRPFSNIKLRTVTITQSLSYVAISGQ